MCITGKPVRFTLAPKRTGLVGPECRRKLAVETHRLKLLYSLEKLR